MIIFVFITTSFLNQHNICKHYSLLLYHPSCNIINRILFISLPSKNRFPHYVISDVTGLFFQLLKIIREFIFIHPESNFGPSRDNQIQKEKKKKKTVKINAYPYSFPFFPLLFNITYPFREHPRGGGEDKLFNRLDPMLI